MTKSDSYSIKEMITEFRGDVKDSFSRVTDRLDKIDNKQAEANHRTSKLEIRLSDYEEIKEGTKDLITTKKAIIIFASSLVFIVGSVFGIMKYAVDKYIKDTATAFLEEQDPPVHVDDSGWHNQ